MRERRGLIATLTCVRWWGLLVTWWGSLVLRAPVAQPFIPTARRRVHPDPDAVRPDILGLENPLLTALFALFSCAGPH